jgi:hypothetical protein
MTWITGLGADGSATSVPGAVPGGGRLRRFLEGISWPSSVDRHLEREALA